MKVFELYSGIGGMHFALKESGVNAEVVRAVDINTTANVVYRLNFPGTILLEKNIQSLDDTDFTKVNIQMILMSPPCQPHTRNGLKKDKFDQRSDSLLYFLQLLPTLKTVDYILLENVKGFEVSKIRDELIEVLIDNNFTWQEFLLTPSQFGIPNSRLRYYLLAKRKPLQFCFDTENCIMEKLPHLRKDVESEIVKMNAKNKKLSGQNLCYSIGAVIENEASTPVPEKVLLKYGSLFDIVTNESIKSCCFTKGYGHFVEGTGSVLSLKTSEYVKEILDELKKCSNDSVKQFELAKSLNLRYFTPKEVSRLMCFPEELIFPSYLTDKQKYRLLGNSINVHVVAILIRILAS